MAANNGWISIKLKPQWLWANAQIVIKYAFVENYINFAHFGGYCLKIQRKKVVYSIK